MIQKEMIMNNWMQSRSIQIKTYKGADCCYRSLTNRLTNSNWLAREFLSKFRRNPNYEINEMVNLMQEKYAPRVNK